MLFFLNLQDPTKNHFRDVSFLYKEDDDDDDGNFGPKNIDSE